MRNKAIVMTQTPSRAPGKAAFKALNAELSVPEAACTGASFGGRA
jgi:hypothetical protein